MTEKKAHTIIMSGATGFVGSHLRKRFQKEGWKVVIIDRKALAMATDELAGKMQGGDIIVNLAGAPVIGRWSKEYKKILYNSRITVTSKLIQACHKMDTRPDLFISTSAVGYYSDQGTNTEKNYVQAEGFLGHLAHDWEQEALKATELGLRTVVFRFGVVLGKDGGALKKMLLPFKLGLGGTIGNGSQSFSWIHIEDLIRAYLQAIDDSTFSGVYNLASPKPTTNRGLTKALGRVLCRPTLLRVPKFVLRLRFGEGAETLTGGQEVLPERLQQSGFDFVFPDIESAVKDCVS